MTRKIKEKTTVLHKVGTVIKVFTFIGIIAWIGLYYLNYKIGDAGITKEGESIFLPEKKKEINLFFCGENENLTDTMIYVKYNTETGKIAMMSIPRDTYTTSPYVGGGAGGHKLNSMYRGENIIPLTEYVGNLLDVKMDYYVVVDNAIVRDIVDAIGGIEVNVPIRMKYDDPTQNLHINLKPGLQVLDGKQVEMFIRFRKNNDGTGYARGDLERTEVQQEFIKKFIANLMQPANILKLPQLVNIALKNTQTNMTTREILRYSVDLKNIDKENIKAFTAPGEGKYIEEYGMNISYYVVDKEEARQIIKTEFDLSNTVNTTHNIDKKTE